ncbi:hypothetical protein GGX14DRAFT_389330 [Mycena pura]|uniref:Uncharacterized protein n=1 Tax=Mycena pura TaxID=153505 RepID=A0AAD6VWH6_9AGAR|nr:hypothetical protein GGX14DRAFT_389330 [Mycena pura]
MILELTRTLLGAQVGGKAVTQHIGQRASNMRRRMWCTRCEACSGAHMVEQRAAVHTVGQWTACMRPGPDGYSEDAPIEPILLLLLAIYRLLGLMPATCLAFIYLSIWQGLQSACCDLCGEIINVGPAGTTSYRLESHNLNHTGLHELPSNTKPSFENKLRSRLEILPHSLR